MAGSGVGSGVEVRAGWAGSLAAMAGSVVLSAGGLLVDAFGMRMSPEVEVVDPDMDMGVGLAITASVALSAGGWAVGTFGMSSKMSSLLPKTE